MGWKEREWYLGPHAPRLFDSNGNAGQTIWVDGKIVGAWGQRKSGEVVWEVLEDIGRESLAEVERQAAEAGDLAQRQESHRPLRFPAGPRAVGSADCARLS